MIKEIQEEAFKRRIEVAKDEIRQELLQQLSTARGSADDAIPYIFLCPSHTKVALPQNIIAKDDIEEQTLKEVWHWLQCLYICNIYI